MLILFRPAISQPGTDFILIYLINPDGKIIDWKSCWSDNCVGGLRWKMRDVNSDGIKEICFVLIRGDTPEQLFAAYTVESSRFYPLVAEEKTYFEVILEDVLLPNGLLLHPLQPGRPMLVTDKLYEISVRVLNQSNKEIDLKDHYLWISNEEGWCGGGVGGYFSVETLKPGDHVDTTVTIRFSERMCDRKINFTIKRADE